MDDPPLVGGLQRLGDLTGKRLVERDRTLRDPVLQRRAFDQFQDERPPVSALFESVDLGNVRVVQRGQHLGFALEASQAFRIVGKGVR